MITEMLRQTAVNSASHQKRYLVHASLDQLGLVDTGYLHWLVLHVSARHASASVAGWGLADLRWAVLVVAQFHISHFPPGISRLAQACCLRSMVKCKPTGPVKRLLS